MALPDITRISPNKTPGWNTGEPHIIIVHGTRGGALYGTEFDATLNWFSSEASQVSAHWVIARDGTTARVVPDSHRAWHAAEHNGVAIGIELEQPNSDDEITTPQYEKLHLIGRTYYPSIPMIHRTNVAQAGWIEHRETPQGIGMGKSDVGTFDWQAFFNQEDDMEDFNDKQKESLGGLMRGLLQESWTGHPNSSMMWGDKDWRPPHTLLEVLNKLEALEAKVDAIQASTAPQKVRFPGATIKVPPVDMPVE